MVSPFVEVEICGADYDNAKFKTKTISDNEDIKEFYLGLTGVGQRKSYRDVKHYHRRKRWLS
jgi:hypothetical protein